MGSVIEPGHQTQAVIVYAMCLRLARGTPDHVSLQGHETQEVPSLRVMWGGGKSDGREGAVTQKLTGFELKQIKRPVSTPGISQSFLLRSLAPC